MKMKLSMALIRVEPLTGHSSGTGVGSFFSCGPCIQQRVVFRNPGERNYEAVEAEEDKDQILLESHSGHGAGAVEGDDGSEGLYFMNRTSCSILRAR